MAAKKRGRPSTGKALTGSERVKRHRERAAKDGGKRLDLVLDRASSDALDACLKANPSVTMGQLIGALLQREAERLKAG